MIKLFLFDIEGTTTDIAFVHKVLFPYSAENLEGFVLEHEHDSAQKAIAQVKETVRLEDKKEIDTNQVISTLKKWINEDRKHPALKELQGLIWDKGYSQNAFKGHVYPDVAPFFKKIREGKAQIGIYSSGSVHAQKLIFGFSSDGDLTPYISHFFDTKVGHKREKSSYEKITHEVNLRPEEIMFFSDIPEELEAAQLSGMKVTHVIRPGTAASSFENVTNFLPFMDFL